MNLRNEKEPPAAAENLMSTVVDHARQHEIKLFGLCPFAKRQLDTRSEYADVKY